MKRLAIHLWFVLMLTVCLWALSVARGEPAQPQIVLPCRVIRVHDGDTPTVAVTVVVNVRLLRCWAPELDQPGGKEARDKLIEIAAGKSGVLVVPLSDNLGKSLSLDRVLGRIEIDGRDVSEQMVESGHATRTKGAKR